MLELVLKEKNRFLAHLFSSNEIVTIFTISFVRNKTEMFYI